ncbi:serine/threonine protein kinase [Nocardia sp. NBC_01503]|uniref:serine/threonine-protein kinase n=1 Tax=Nocardia sp. NBC_01503 TaxID=2975997 RepID=UPI002E7C083B|nr:serine/threonine-protein kinase [Nocardia sp. NBC_01503]WTL32237.1 serine/threonine protein kinase [Nocardia sp. NBC_01503]
MDRLEGAVFAGYRIEQRLGSGGTAVVYRARHPRLPRYEALKILVETHSDDPEFQARFLREAEIASQLDHPNLVSVHDRGIHHGQLWIAMQYIDGTDAAALIRHGRAALPPERAIAIIAEAARGLDEIHRSGLVHRDVKPHNIMVTKGRDGNDRVLVTDFGIARSADATDTLGDAGSMVGTLAYAAPEQLEIAPVDHRADIYALGCTLYQMLTGTMPFPRTDPGGMVRAHLMSPPPQPSATGLGLPLALDAVIARAMAKDPAHRYPSCGALAADAAVALRNPATAPAPPMPPAADMAGGSAQPTIAFPPGSESRRARSSNPHGLVDARQWPSNTAPASEHALTQLGAASATDVRAARTRRMRRALGIGSGVAVLVLVAAISAVALRDIGAHPTGPSSTTTTGAAATTPPTTALSVADYPAWKSYAYIPAAFPGLLPKQPNALGIGGSGNCFPVDTEGKTLTVDQVSGATADIFCAGVTPPAESLLFICLADRTPMPVAIAPDATPEGSQEWTRASGSGRMLWGHGETKPGRVRGVLQVFFDAPARYFCSLTVTGASTGEELLQRWWPSAPL